MLVIVFTICLASDPTVCETRSEYVPTGGPQGMTHLYCQMGGGLAVASQFVNAHPKYRIGGKIHCINGVPL